MTRIIVAGCGTDVGKTIISAILVEALNGDYWKPIQCGGKTDANTIRSLTKNRVHPSAYTFKAPLSPHHAARLEQKEIDLNHVVPPITEHPLVIESVGGILVPLNQRELSLPLFQSWEGIWIMVSRHYLGSINHTLLTMEALKNQGIQVHSIVFNGAQNLDTEEAILHFSGVPCLGRLLPETHIHQKVIKRYVKQWKPILEKEIIHLSGTPLPKHKQLER